MLVDRLEELLAAVEDEDGEEREDETQLRMAAESTPAPAPGRETGQADASGERGGEAAPGREENAGEEPPPERRRNERARGAGEAGDAADEGVLAAKDLNEPLWDKMGLPAPRRGQAGERMPAGTGGRTSEPPDEAAGADAPGKREMEAERGLEELYRRTVQAVRPAVQIPSAQGAERTAWAEEPEKAASLTVDELDRAVRRDSRRYDGGMTIY